MKTYYQVVCICEFGESVNRERFETLTSLYHFFHEYLKSHSYVLRPCLFVTRYWQLDGRFYPSGCVPFNFNAAPADFRNNRWIKNKLSRYFDCDWVFDSRVSSFVVFSDKMHVVNVHDYKKFKVEVHDNNELPF